MFHRSVFFAALVVLEVVYSLPHEEKIEPVELFHICIDPERYENEPVKSPIVLLHGLFASHKSYDEIGSILANRTKRRVCSVDLRNHGDSPWNDRADVAAMTVDIDHFLDTQNIKKVNFIGESLGGKVAIHYTLNNPDRVNSLVIEDMHPSRLRTIVYIVTRFIAQLLQNIMMSQPKDMNQDQANRWTKERFNEEVQKFTAYQDIPEDAIKYFEIHLINGKWQLKHNIKIMTQKLNKLNGLWTESTGLYTGPSLFIYGTESAFKVGEETDAILKMFPNARLLPIEGLGHVVHQLYPDYKDIVVKFLNEID